jgi:hypothetical protein
MTLQGYLPEGWTIQTLHDKREIRHSHHDRKLSHVTVSKLIIQPPVNKSLYYSHRSFVRRLSSIAISVLKSRHAKPTRRGARPRQAAPSLLTALDVGCSPLHPNSHRLGLLRFDLDSREPHLRSTDTRAVRLLKVAARASQAAAPTELSLPVPTQPQRTRYCHTYPAARSESSFG